MIFKVFFQDWPNEAPVRERTKSLYIKAESKKEVLKKLTDKEYNIEYIQKLNEIHLDYERQSENFKMENV